MSSNLTYRRLHGDVMARRVHCLFEYLSHIFLHTQRAIGEGSL
jgi:hypothetical protein